MSKSDFCAGEGESSARMPKSDFCFGEEESNARMPKSDFCFGEEESSARMPKSDFCFGEEDSSARMPKSDFSFGDGECVSCIPKSFAATVDRVGLLLIDKFWANETSVEDTVRDELGGGAFDPSFGLGSSWSPISRKGLEGDVCSPAALNQVPRTRIGEAPAEELVWRS